jgi:4-hydroxy-3-methylbut-2-enyl diphosphate reductase
VGILSQTTQIPQDFLEFIKAILGTVYVKDSEIRIIDTICHDIRDRQTAALDLAKRVDVMLVIGGRNSANTAHLAELCATVTETHKVATPDELDATWFKGKEQAGITAGASTPEETIDAIVDRLNRIH